MINMRLSCQLSKFVFYLFIIFTFSTFVFSCSSRNLEDFREEGEGTVRALTAELKKIRTRDDLLVHAPKLKKMFDSLVDLIIQAETYKKAHPEDETAMHQKRDQSASDQLRIELNRILHMEGGREVIEKVQEDALNRLDLFHQKQG